MSHFSRIKIQIKNGDTLHEILQELAYNVELNGEVRGYQGELTHADYVIKQKNGYDLGFRLSGDSYELVADFWGAQINQSEFLNKINQKYAHRTLMKSVKNQGFDVEEESVLEDGTVRVVVGRWV